MAWQVVIAGGGFGGFYAARTLARVLPPHSARVRLVTEDNFMLYTPLLPGAAAGTLEPRHVVVPLREELDSSVQLRLARITGASPQRNVIHVRSFDGGEEELAYHQLVVALGSVSRTLPIPGLGERRGAEVAARGDRAAHPRHPHARDRRDARGRRRAPRAPHVRLRRRRLCGLGWGPVLGVDHEHEALAAARENARRNGVELELRHGDLLHSGGPAPSAPTIVANLLRPLLEHVARAGFDGEPPRVLVAGGLLRAEADAIAAAFAAAHGLQERARRERAGWVALMLGRAPDESRGTSTGKWRPAADAR